MSSGHVADIVDAPQMTDAVEKSKIEQLPKFREVRF